MLRTRSSAQTLTPPPRAAHGYCQIVEGPGSNRTRGDSSWESHSESGSYLFSLPNSCTIGWCPILDAIRKDCWRKACRLWW